MCLLLATCLLQATSRGGVLLSVGLTNLNQTSYETTFDIQATLSAFAVNGDSILDDVYSLTLGLENSSPFDFNLVTFETLPLDNAIVPSVLPWFGFVDPGNPDPLSYRNPRLFLEDVFGRPLLNSSTMQPMILGRLHIGTLGLINDNYSISLVSTDNAALGTLSGSTPTSGHDVRNADIVGGSANFSVSNISAVPEPPSCWLLGIGVVAAALLRKSRRI